MKITLVTGTVTKLQTALELRQFLEKFSEDDLNAMHLKAEDENGEVQDLEFEGVFVEDEHLSDKSVVHNLVFVLDSETVSDESRSYGPHWKSRTSKL